MHIGVFILLLLSGERNFGVRLNKPYSVHVPMDIPVFTGTHADLLIVVRRRLTTLVLNCPVCPPVQRLPVLQVFHKIITTGHQRLQPLFDCLLTIIVNGESLWQQLTAAFQLKSTEEDAATPSGGETGCIDSTPALKKSL